MKKSIYVQLLIIILLLNACQKAPTFLHSEGKSIVNGQGEEVILRGIGTGNWMIQEGYMMMSSRVAGTQHAFREKLIENIGLEKTDVFYDLWLSNGITKVDIDSMKVWGFNSVRVALHYLWFTPPIGEEPVSGEITWNSRGFEMMDSLLQWCGDNEMYLILDMHGVPGAQGKNAPISDYDPIKPSLWESEANQEKLIALWKKLAKRYADEPWMGGYDLINETNWDFEDSGNQNGCNCSKNEPLNDIFKKLIDAIREVDNNHIIYLGGNCWGNNYRGFEDIASYDDNLVMSFHKYWNYNTQESIAEILAMRDKYDVPIWMGEGGENSNTWFANAIALFEKNSIGWSWWPVKKFKTNNIFRVQVNEDYTALLNSWKEGEPKMSDTSAFQAVMQWATNHKAENCMVQYDVIDAMIRQPFSTETLPYGKHVIGAPIFISDYDLGRSGHANYDLDSATYRTSTGENTVWNKGGEYRNDGVDIEKCNDQEASNGYSVSWTDNGEWLKYTLGDIEEGEYILQLRYAAVADTTSVHFELNGDPVMKATLLPNTGNLETWKTYEFKDVIAIQGQSSIKLVIDKGGVNLNYFRLVVTD